MASETRGLVPFTMPLKGKMIWNEDRAGIGTNYWELVNLRYTETHLQGVAGVTAINSTAEPTYYAFMSGIHFIKDQPSESHVIVHAHKSDWADSKLMQVTAAIPGTGTLTDLLTGLTSGGRDMVGRFSLAPGGNVVFSDTITTYIWSGTETRCVGFIHRDTDDLFEYDYADILSNTLQDTLNVATLYPSAGGLDAATMLLLPFDNNVTDVSPTTPHTVTNVGSKVTFSTTVKVFGTHAAVLNGTDAYLTIPDDPDFDFSGGNFTIDCRVRITNATRNHVLFYKATDANNYIQFYIDTNRAIGISVFATGAEVLGTIGLKTANNVMPLATWKHVQFVESGNAWYIFLDGVRVAYISDASRAANYTGVVQIGCFGSAFMLGYLDEYRVSNTARNTANFTPRTSAYYTSTNACVLYVGALRPLDGFKLYVKTANTNASTMTVNEWTGSSWSAVSSLVDNTRPATISLAVPGTVTFASTISTSRLKMESGVLLYWYKVEITSISSGVQLYYVTVSQPFQSIKDIWDGVLRPELSTLVKSSSAANYVDATLNVYEDFYYSTDDATYISLASLATTGEIVVGFAERMTGLALNITASSGNTNDSVLTVSYWDGDSWTPLVIDDQTSESGKSFARSGYITWTAPIDNIEFMTDIGKGYSLYYYKLTFSAALSATLLLYYVAGISAPATIRPYKFPVVGADRLWLCNELSKYKNKVICSAYGTSDVWSGDDTAEFFFGDDTEIMAGCCLYSQYGSNLYNIMIFCKRNETWILTGSSWEDWKQYRVSDKIGCVAPHTMKVLNFPTEQVPNINRNVAIWQSADGIVMFDGRTFTPLHHDIMNVFTGNNAARDYEGAWPAARTVAINRTYEHLCAAFYDTVYDEYHWVFPTSTAACGTELILDMKKMKWFEIYRALGSTSYALQFGIEVKSLRGDSYIYGLPIVGGQIWRLENGQTWEVSGATADLDIAYSFMTGDFVLGEEGTMFESEITHIRLIAVAKNTTANSITLKHYGDALAPSLTVSPTSYTLSPAASGKRLAQPIVRLSPNAHTYHRLAFTISTGNETIGFEPIVVAGFYRVIRPDMK